jgi:hypothetical protein
MCGPKAGGALRCPPEGNPPRRPRPPDSQGRGDGQDGRRRSETQGPRGRKERGEHEDYIVHFPSAGTWIRRFNGDSKAYGSDFGDLGADQVEAAGDPPKAAVDMGKYSLQIFSRNPR